VKDDNQGVGDQEAEAELWAEAVIEDVRQHGMFWRLADYIAVDSPMTPGIRGLLLDIIEGRLRPSGGTRRQSHPKSDHYERALFLRKMLENYQRRLRGPDWTEDEERELESLLSRSGWRGDFPEGRTEMAKADQMIMIRRFKLSEAILEDLLQSEPRRARGSSRKSSGEIPG